MVALGTNGPSRQARHATASSADPRTFTATKPATDGTTESAAVIESVPLWWKIADGLMLLSPRTWLGAYRVAVESPFVPFDAAGMVHTLCAFLLPFVTLLVLNGSILYHQRGIPFLPVLASPWIANSICTLHPYIRQLAQQVARYRTNRFTALPDAIAVVNNRVETSRLLRFRRFDLYLPPVHQVNRSSSRSNTTAELVRYNNRPSSELRTSEYLTDHNALILIPGAFVPHTAYAEVAARLSDSGVVVAVMSLEPARLAHRHLGADVRSIRTVIRKTERLLSEPCLRWSLLGHSMGSFVAARAWSELSFVKELVLWGTGPFVDLSTNLTRCGKTTRILLVQGTNDSVLQFGVAQGWWDEFESLFPRRQTIWHWIVNGTHDGFASYDELEHQRDDGKASSAVYNPRFDYARGRQHELACNVTSNFLHNAARADTKLRHDEKDG